MVMDEDFSEGGYYGMNEKSVKAVGKEAPMKQRQ